jgi:hypothetical protein
MTYSRFFRAFRDATSQLAIPGRERADARAFAMPPLTEGDRASAAIDNGSCGSDSRSSCGSGGFLDLFNEFSDVAHGRSASERDEASAATAHDDLMATLGDRYYRALESADSLFGEWVDGGASSGEMSADIPAANRDFSDAPSSPIIGLLSDLERLEEAFGPLRNAGVGVPFEVEKVPEILRLFAPPEFQASAARRLDTVLPSIARRDHHTLAIDSPLVAPNGMTSTDSVVGHAE